MITSAQLPGAKDSEPKGPTARKGAIFFCAAALTAGLCGLLFGVSCSHISSDAEKDVIASNPQTALESETKPSAAPAGSPSQGKGDERKSIEELEMELERAQFGNVLLKEENDWLRSEVIKLPQELAEATQTIYSLNRKLDAIFKPNNMVE